MYWPSRKFGALIETGSSFINFGVHAAAADAPPF
jgi:hypothetical protein